MAKNNLVVIAKATGGKIVLAESEGVLSQEHEAWLKEAGFDALKRDDAVTWVGFRPKNQNLLLRFEVNHRGELTWITKLFGKTDDIFGKAAQRVPSNHKLAVKDLKKLKDDAIKLDDALEKYYVNYTAVR